MLVLDEDFETAGDDEEERLIVLAAAVQHHAAGQAEPVGFAQQATQGGIVEIGEQREVGQPLAERLGVNRLAPGAKG